MIQLAGLVLNSFSTFFKYQNKCASLSALSSYLLMSIDIWSHIKSHIYSFVFFRFNVSLTNSCTLGVAVAVKIQVGILFTPNPFSKYSFTSHNSKYSGLNQVLQYSSILSNSSIIK